MSGVGASGDLHDRSTVGVTHLSHHSLACENISISGRSKIHVISSLDGTEQPSYLSLPAGCVEEGDPLPLVVSLHPWSSDLESRDEDLERLVEEKRWLYLCPNFRGRNDQIDALGSELARQDILDAVEWVSERYPVDPRRIFLTGGSGGGHMTMLMVARHPDGWTAASAWVGISNLTSWHARHVDGKYGKMMRSALGGAPEDSEEIAARYLDRSPLTHLANAKDVALDIAAGIHDGHTGSVPVRHSLDAFNVIAQARGDATISETEIEQLSQPDGRLVSPSATDTMSDASLGREIYLRRTTGRTRVTIFEGGHEGIAEATIDWFEQHARGTFQQGITSQNER